MVFKVVPAAVDRFRFHPVERRFVWIFCFALLTVSCALASFALTCATPFAAFAFAAAATLPLRPALLVVSGAWLVNQSIGFGALHYPIDASTIAWGFVIGAAALAATAASAAVLRALVPNRTPLALALALVCAYGAYELMLFAPPPFLRGARAFTIPIATPLRLFNLTSRP